MKSLCRTELSENPKSPQKYLTEIEQQRLDTLKAMDSDHPDFNLLELLELHFKANPTYVQRIRETVDEW